MFRSISAVLLACAVLVALLWRWTGDGPATSAPRAAPAVTHDEPSSPSEGSAEASAIPGSRIENAREGSPELPPSAAAKPPSSAPGVQRGRLDDAVPRPVLDGRVRVRLDGSGTGDAAQVARDFEAEVRADGTFELADLPPGRGQIVASCRGWVSRRTPFDPIEKVTLRLGRQPSMGEIEQAFQEEGPETLEAQRIAVPSRTPLVVAMAQTGAVLVTVRRRDGAPLAGAVVRATPGLRWIDGSTIFSAREWSAETDAQGLARLDDLPPDESLAVEARHASFRMTRANGAETKSAAIVSGRTAELALVLEPAGD